MNQYNNGLVGVSKYTPIKQTQFRTIIRTHIEIVQKIYAKKKPFNPFPPYLYFDMMAGPGYYNLDCTGELITGSPLIFLEEAELQSLSFNAVFIEQEEQNYRALAEYVVGRGRCYLGDVNKVFPENFYGFGPEKYGLVYLDCNGSPAKDGLENLISHISTLQRYKKVDIIIHCAARHTKRSRVVHGTKSLLDVIRGINKDYWLVRYPDHPQHDYTFLIGTNWNGFPRFKKLGFCRLETKEGRDILKRIDMTISERENGDQLPLF